MYNDRTYNGKVNRMRNKQDYRKLESILMEMEDNLRGGYLTDASVDMENVLGAGIPELEECVVVCKFTGETDRYKQVNPAYWAAMYNAAESAAQSRAEEQGFNIYEYVDFKTNQLIK
tara:strand:- start:440 stop:790 length:351 start_codon:yes stop_codon:yes gene_type:complete